LIFWSKALAAGGSSALAAGLRLHRTWSRGARPGTDAELSLLASRRSASASSASRPAAKVLYQLQGRIRHELKVWCAWINRQTGKELPLPWVPHLIDSSPSIWCLFSIPSWSIPRHRFTSDSLRASVSAVSTGACPGRRVTWERGPESEGVRRRRPSAAGAAGREGGTAWGPSPW
jgi:hypothetical protein